MTQAQRDRIMRLMHAIARWQSHEDSAEYDEVRDLLLHSVDNFDSDTMAELIRVIQGGPSLSSVQ